MDHALSSEEKNPRSKNPLGWILGGLSVFNLIDELSLLRLHGKLEKWMEAYTAFVGAIGNFLFGWIRFGWLSVSSNEMHLLVIAGVVIAAYFRAHARLQRSRLESLGSIVVSCGGAAVVYFGLVLLPAVLFPAWGGSAGSLLMLVFLSFVFFFDNESHEDFPPRELIRRELKGVLAVTLLLIVGNYVLSGIAE